MSLLTHGEFVRGIACLVPQAPHMSPLYALALEVDEVWPWPDAGRSPESFERSLRDGIFAHYVLQDLRTGELAGYVAISGVSLIHGIGLIRCYFATAARRSVAPLAAVARLIDRYFEYLPVRHLYAEMTDTTYRNIGDWVFDETNVFHERLVIRGQPADLVTGRISRQGWNRAKESFGTGDA